MKKLLKFTKYLKPYRVQVLLAVLLLISVVYMDLSIPRLVQKIIDDGIYQNNMDAIRSTSILMLGFSILSTLFSIIQNILSVQASEAFARDLRLKIFQKIQSLSYGNLDKLKTGDLIVRLTSDINILQQTFRMSMRIGMRGPLLIVGSILLMVRTDPSLTLRIVPILLATLIFIGVVIAKLGPLFKKVQKKLGNLNNVLQENIAGVRVVKAFVRKDYEEERFEVVNEDFKQIHVKILRNISVVFPLLMLLINAGILLIVWVGGRQAIAGDISIGEIVAFTNYLTTTMVPLLIMAMLANVFASGMASAERLDEVLESEPEVRQDENAKTLPEKIKGQIEFKNVDFYYTSNCDEKVLDDVSFTAEPGQNVAILGATGSGKSTIIHLIPRFYDANAGEIRIDGVNLKKLSQDSLLSHVSITPQETVLFSGTIRDNISYGKPEAQMEEIVSAAKAAQAHDFIEGLPDGYETHVAARGVNLSGGQKQRIAIARAILPKPEILILDDSTSSVDVETETKIQDALAEWIKDTTTVIVAQRISTVLRADKIIVIDKGKVKDVGTHAELIKTSSIYQEIYESQLGDGNQLLENGSSTSGMEK